MEKVDGSDYGTVETHLIQGSEASPFVVAAQPLEQAEAMGNDGTPKFILDQGLYYSPTNYYGYYCTGFDSPSEWDDHPRFFGIDGQDLHIAGLQTENLPFVYYTPTSPTYEFAQSPYNPYNPYIPGAYMGVDGSYVGSQTYYPGSAYQYPTSSSAYYPLVLQPGADGVPNSSSDPHSLNAGASIINGPYGAGLKENTSFMPVSTTRAPLRPAAADGRAEAMDNGLNMSQPYSKRSEGSKSSATLAKRPTAIQTVASGTVSHSALPHIAQSPGTSASTQVANQIPRGVSSTFNSTKAVVSVNGLSDFGSNARGWGVVDKFKPRFHYGGDLKYGNGNTDLLGEQNRGPRTNRLKNQGVSSISQGDIIISADNYNREDFSVNYVDAKFFVIKSYSEDDVHKSIKYNVWSSTPNGNKRLENAYEDAQKISAGKPSGCPIFLFFSVNASGQFCGVAEMTGPVDFNKDMNFWQQDKWSGSFPVKWHFIKDVPNTNFRHIILENNENKPVTNSRDTQEIHHKPGIDMLNIFKNYLAKTSLLDDFMYYEERQKIMQEEKKRYLGKTYDNSSFMPAVVPPTQLNGVVDQRPSLNDLSKPDIGQSNSAKDEAENNLVGDEKEIVLKFGSLNIDLKKQGEARP
ncbi:YTH domain-containing family protein 1-like isoform X1 [Papaver somniferum]|nr:YTH domain-containing family protein 1-like isoform X1 [Papaver somniferum]